MARNDEEERFFEVEQENSSTRYWGWPTSSFKGRTHYGLGQGESTFACERRGRRIPLLSSSVSYVAWRSKQFQCKLCCSTTQGNWNQHSWVVAPNWQRDWMGGWPRRGPDVALTTSKDKKTHGSVAGKWFVSHMRGRPREKKVMGAIWARAKRTAVFVSRTNVGGTGRRKPFITRKRTKSPIAAT